MNVVFVLVCVCVGVGRRSKIEPARKGYSVYDCEWLEVEWRSEKVEEEEKEKCPN